MQNFTIRKTQRVEIKLVIVFSVILYNLITLKVKMCGIKSVLLDILNMFVILLPVFRIKFKLGKILNN